jgi:hypothetical protein
MLGKNISMAMIFMDIFFYFNIKILLRKKFKKSKEKPTETKINFQRLT